MCIIVYNTGSMVNIVGYMIIFDNNEENNYSIYT